MRRARNQAVGLREPRRRLTRRARAALAACALAGLTACATLGGPDVGDLPRIEPGQPPLVVVPGLLASRLVDPETGRRVWPPNILMLIRGWRMRDLSMPVPHDARATPARLEPTDVVLSRPRRDYYASLLDTLAAIGYECVPRAELTADTNCVLFSWDWRRGAVTAAARLERLVDEMRALRGDAALRIDLVGHSAGALVARYFAQFGGADVVAAGAGAVEPSTAVRRLVLIGPPNRGSVFAAQRLMRGYALSIFTVHPEVLATFDSTYELLPHPEREWLVDARGDRVERDLYDIETWRHFAVSIFDPVVRARAASRFDSADEAQAYLEALEQRFGNGLERARRFHAALSSPRDDDPARHERLVVGSDCESTPRYMLAEVVDGRPVLRLHPDAVKQRLPGVDYEALMLEPGDGRVTRSSLLSTSRTSAAPADAAALVCERHSEMTSNARVQREMLEFLVK